MDEEVLLPLLLRPIAKFPRSLKGNGLVEGSDSAVKPVILDGKLVDIEIHGFKNFTEEEKVFYINAINLKLRVLSSSEFKKRWLSTPMKETNGLTRLQAYTKILSGYDAFSRHIDGDLDFFFNLYYQKSDTIGYTYIGKLGTYTNRYFLAVWMKDPYGHAYLAGHLFHEYLHSVGFKHKFTKKGTLVYKGGYLVRDMGKEIIDGKELELDGRLMTRL
jgi:hypothetical protein